MNVRTYYKLLKENFDAKWLKDVKENWSPKKFGDYEITITCGEHIDSDPADGMFIDRTTFNNDKELSEILHFFEGFHYRMIDVATGKQLGAGILDESPFEEMEEFTGKEWSWYSYEQLQNMKEQKHKRRETYIEKIIRENAELRKENAELKAALKQ